MLLTFVLLTIVVSSLVDVGASYGESFVAHAMSGGALVAAARATGMRPERRRVVEAVVGVALGALLLVVVLEAVTGVEVPDAARADPGWLAVVLLVPVLVIRPATDVARLLVSSEAVFGQLFLVTVVAIVVARFATTPRRK